MTMLFEVRPPGSEAASYLFGTVHARDRRAFAHFEKAKLAIERCERFAAEFDLRDANPFVFHAASALPEGRSLADFLTKPVFKKLEKRLWKEQEIPVEGFQNLHPMLVSSMLAEQVIGEEADVALDEALLRFAQSLGREITGVETFEEQVEVFKKLPIEAAAANLTWSVKNQERMKKHVKMMLETYASGDVLKLYKSARRDARGLRQTLLFERNELMAERIASFAMEKPTFSAVGAGHLAGKKGVVALLKRAGFAVNGI